MTMSFEEILEHHGVKGMKWGKRKDRLAKKYLGVTPQAKIARKKLKAKNAAIKQTTYKTPPKKLSDVDLKKRISRLEAEKRYNTLNKQELTPGKKAVTEILSSSGKQIAKGVATGVGTLLVKNLLESKFGADVAKAVR